MNADFFVECGCLLSVSICVYLWLMRFILMVFQLPIRLLVGVVPLQFEVIELIAEIGGLADGVDERLTGLGGFG